MDFIVAPLIVWICVSGLYGLFELYARRKERMCMYERFGDKIATINPEIFKGKFGLPLLAPPSFSGLKIGCLLVGVGLGLVVGLFFNLEVQQALREWNDWRRGEFFSVAYGAPVLLFGGLGLIISFLVEKNAQKKFDNSTNQ
ncbi:MAG: hypothetical protein LBP98_07480 [Tannerella sp.]|nr:hypothetical protein [Tannerella sp.]